MNSKPKPKINGKDVWFSVSKSPGERRKCKILSKNKKVLIEVGLAQAQEVRIDYKRGVLFIRKTRVAEWKESGPANVSLSYFPARLKEVGIDVPLDKLENAVREEMAE